MDNTQYHQTVSRQDLQCECGLYMYSTFDKVYLAIHGKCIDCSSRKELEENAQVVWDTIEQYG